jgi:hypothetical protein
MIAATLFVMMGTSADEPFWIPGRGVMVISVEGTREDGCPKGSHKK